MSIPDKKTLVIKLGGAALQQISREQLPKLFDEIATLHQKGMPLIIVHGGGPQISTLCQRLQMPVTFSHGLRITDAETLEVVKMVMLGTINCEIVNKLNHAGVKAIGLSGIDSGFIQAKKHISKNIDYGFVGDVSSICTNLLESLLSTGFVPVIAPLGIDVYGQIYNINADSAAGAIASSLHAEKLMLVSDVDGFYKDPNDPVTLLPTILQTEIQLLLQQNKISGGMLPKIEASLYALAHGVPCVHILNGKTPNNLLAAVAGQAIGTQIFGNEMTHV